MEGLIGWMHGVVMRSAPSSAHSNGERMARDGTRALGLGIAEVLTGLHACMKLDQVLCFFLRIYRSIDYARECRRLIILVPRLAMQTVPCMSLNRSAPGLQLVHYPRRVSLVARTASILGRLSQRNS